MSKKRFWWLIGILLSPVLLFVVLVLLLYLPPVQNWAVDKVAEIASEKTGMQISVGHVNLSFPLDLVLDDFKMIKDTDTIADVERLVADVQLKPLLKKRVVINQLEFSNTRLNTNGFIDAARVKGDFQRLFVRSRGIDLDVQTVEVNGARLEAAHLDVALNDSVPEDSTTTPTLWKIMADSVAVVRSDVALHMPGDTMAVAAHLGLLVARQAHIDLGAETYSVGSVDWTDGALHYDQNFEPFVEGLDYNHLGLNDIHIGIDSIYYHDPTLRLYLRQLALKEKSGLEVTNVSGPVAMENGSLRLPKFQLTTPNSTVYLTMDLPLSLTDSIDPGKMRLMVDAELGRQDLMPFMTALPEGLRSQWPYYPLTVKGQLKGNLDYMDFSDIDVSLPTVFHVTATGFAANVTDPQRLRADVQFKGQMQQLNMVTALLPRDVQRQFRIPVGITAEGRVKADGSQYFADVTAREGGGEVKVRGNFHADRMVYDADVSVRQLNVHHFMPHDSIYTVTADVKAKGQGTDPFSPGTVLDADVMLHHLHYGSWQLTDVTAQATIQNGRGHADIVSHNDLLDGTLHVGALMQKQRLDATVVADISSVDLYKMKLLDRPLAIGVCGHVDVTSDLKLSHRVSGLFNDLMLRDSVRTYRPSDIGLLVNTRPDTTYVRAQSGDFIVKVDASGDYEHLLQNLSTLGDSLLAQYEARVIDQQALRRLLPTMKLHVESKSDNPIVTFLKTSNDIGIQDLLIDAVTTPSDGIQAKGYVHALTLGETQLDTINFRVTHSQERLSFGGQVRNNKKNPQFVFNALFDGIVQQRGATLGVRYFDRDNRMGARLGVQAEMMDSGLNLHLVPERPTLGYKEFNLNKDNYILLGHDKKVQAKIDLIADDGTGVKIYSTDSDLTALQDVTISLNRFNLAELTSVIPYVPRMSGLMDGDFHVILDADSHLSVVSDMQVQNMTYEHSPLGNVSTELVYLQKEGDAHAIEARMMKDDEEIALLTGTYYNKDESSVDAKVQLERLPLSLVNGFVPDQLFGLHGFAEGELTVKGQLSEPHVNGEVFLDSSYVESIPYGVTLRFDNDPVRIVDSKLLLENFTVYAYNNNPLNIQGDIDFSHPDETKVNLRMRANNFQLIGAKERPNSIAYGKAFVNVFARMSGPVDNLNLRGRLDVLGSTDMSYVLRDSPLSTDNQLDELVKFTDFGDTATVVVERPPLNGLRMDMTIDVSKGSHITAFLNTDHSNYIDLMGGGTLRMLYTPADNISLRGRYTLSDGEMKYSMPVIPLKTFTIQDGSYIEFTGDPTNPTLNIKATERKRASVTNSSGGARMVEFECGVVITKTLNDMGLEFTLDAPEDMQLHSELQAMGLEQRGKLAVSMLTTGMYLDDGNTGTFSMNSALSSFLSSEISQITGNALRTLDLSVGMDNATDAAGNTHTDYSFKFAKRFMNNRLKIAIGGKVSSGNELQQRNNSFFDNVTLEYRLDQTANKFVTLFYQNNSYDWLDGYTQKYGGGFIWRRSLQTFWDIFRFKDQQPQRSPLTPGRPGSPSQPVAGGSPTDTVRVKNKK